MNDDQRLLAAALENNTVVIEELLRNKANPNVKCERKKTLPTRDERWTTTPLHISLELGNLDAVSAFVQAGADVNFKSMRGKTALMRALDLNKPSIAMFLLDTESVDVNLQDSDGNTALFSTCFADQSTEFVERLVSRGCHVDHRNNRNETSLGVAVELGCHDVVRVLLEHGASPNVIQDGCTLLQIAAVGGATDIAKLLLYFGADVNATGNEVQHSPLQIATNQNHCDIATLLVTSGCDCSGVKPERAEENWLLWFHQHVRNTVPLSVLCRNFIRRHLFSQSRHHRDIDQLPLPNKLKQLLKREDLITSEL